jgi:hypothetical protein
MINLKITPSEIPIAIDIIRNSVEMALELPQDLDKIMKEADCEVSV